MAEFHNEEHLSGLARDIRATTTSEQMDLGNYTEQRSRDLVNAAFTTPLTAPSEMIKITFIVGGGKLVRSRYPDDLTRWMVAALRDIGFTEDRSAAETFDSQGTFKQQHDTGQNLKYLIVYPRVACANAAKASSGTNSSESNVVDQNSPEYIVKASEVATFREIVASKIVSYRQKKRLLKILQDDQDTFKAIEEKLISGNQLSPKEQAIYDANTGNTTEKITWLQSEIKSMVDGGQLTQSEKEELLKSLDANLAAVELELTEAKTENKPKKVEKCEEKKRNILTRKGVVEKIEPIQHKLKKSTELQTLHIRLFPLLALEDKGRSMSLTLADLKLLEEKAGIEAAILQCEASSRGWFEDEEDFRLKCALELKEAKAKYNNRVKKSSSGSSSGSKGKTGTNKITGPNVGRSTGSSGGSFMGSSGGSGWSTVKKPSGTTTSVNKKAPASSSGFAAAFAGSDSEDD